MLGISFSGFRVAREREMVGGVNKVRIIFLGILLYSIRGGYIYNLVWGRSRVGIERVLEKDYVWVRVRRGVRTYVVCSRFDLRFFWFVVFVSINNLYSGCENVSVRSRSMMFESGFIKGMLEVFVVLFYYSYCFVDD